MTPKVETTKEKKIGMWDYFKMKDFYILRDTIDGEKGNFKM